MTDRPAITREETSKYLDRQNDGTARLFTFEMGVKSVITSPSPGLEMGAPGIYLISGLAWSGAAAVRRVEVSADGGKSWADAALDAPVLPKCLTRFRAAWQWDGGPAVKSSSRATDQHGVVQPTRSSALRGAPHTTYHYNGIQAWRISEDGKVHNVYV